ncbi:MAG: MFS transporter [Oscillospiraceae bacterium]|nr:MFS transporter [Oscillospiraceae bacterium]
MKNKSKVKIEDKDLNERIPGKESRAYCVGALGQGMMYAIMSSYISDFYMNIMGLGYMFVLLLMLLARIWDAVNDPIMGMIVDRLHPKRGKLIPYLIYFPVPIAILTVLMFYNPAFLSGSMKMVYAAVTYVLWGVIYTIADVPFWSLPNAMTPRAPERGRIFSLARTFNGVGSALPSALVIVMGLLLPRVIPDFARVDEMKFLYTALICSALGFALFFQTPFSVKERVPLPGKNREKRPRGQGSFLVVLGCKPLVLTVLMGILASGRYMLSAAAAHVSRYAFYRGDFGALERMSPAEQTEALQASFSMVSLALQLAPAAGMFLAMTLIPRLIKRWSYKQLIVSSCLAGGAAGLIMYFLGYESFYAIIPCLAVCGIPVGMINSLAFAMVGDCLDYMEWKTGYRENGLGLAFQSFVTKLSNALATSAIVLTYRVVNLDIGKMDHAGANLLSIPAARRPAVRQGMFSLVSIIPAVSLLLCIIPLLFYDLTGQKKDRVMAELAERRAEEKSGPDPIIKKDNWVKIIE